MSDARWDDPRQYGGPDRDDERPRVRRTRPASWRSQNAFCRAHQTCGCRLRSTTSSDCSSCLSRKGIASDGDRFKQTAITASLFNYLVPQRVLMKRVVSLNFASWNQMVQWIRRLEAHRELARVLETCRDTSCADQA